MLSFELERGLFKLRADGPELEVLLNADPRIGKSSTAEYASVQKNVTSTCKVTAVNTKGTHPYHCISQDGKGVYGWVNAADVK